MQLESDIQELNKRLFWEEFHFSRTKFTPFSSTEVELADSFVWFRDFAYIFQMKEHVSEFVSVEQERKWFDNKIKNKAKSQIRDSLKMLRDNAIILLKNDREHLFEIDTRKINDVRSVIVYRMSKNSSGCYFEKFIDSKVSGFIHIFTDYDYFNVIDYLGGPQDFRNYLIYREALIKGGMHSTDLKEGDIAAGYLTGKIRPLSGDVSLLRHFLKSKKESDISFIMRNLIKHLVFSQENLNYYDILMEFFLLSRESRAKINYLLHRARASIDNKSNEIPYIMSNLETKCVFVIIPLPNKLGIGSEKDQSRRAGILENITTLAKYKQMSEKCIGVMLSKDNDYLNIDWCMMLGDWSYDPLLKGLIEGQKIFDEY